jgi:Domain of unknown function (DUF1611_C) P-loop domain
MDVSDWKFAFTTRRVPQDAVADLVVAGNLAPEPGDLLLARIVELGQHRRLELVDGRRAMLFPGDHIVVCYGNRYAPDQFEGLIPDAMCETNLLAAGGVAGEMISRNRKVDDATRIQPIALLAGRDGRRLNLSDFALQPRALPTERPPTMAVVGTSMNAGKTTTAASLVRGLRRAGVKVGAAKVTGTGAGGDPWHLVDAGAYRVLDFVDTGEVSTAGLAIDRLQEIVATVTSHLVDDGMEAIVLEVADGLLQGETAELVCSPVFRSAVDGLLFAAGEAMGAAAGSRWLLDRDLTVLGLSGVMTTSTLARREAEEATGLPVLGREELVDEVVALELLERIPAAVAAAGEDRPRVAPLIAAA